MNYITFYEKYRKASPDGGEYTYCIPEQSDTPEARKEYLLYLYEEKGYPVDMRDIEVGNKYSDLAQLRSKLDRIEAKLKEQLSENYFNGKEGRINFAADTANYLTGFIIRVLELEIE